MLIKCSANVDNGLGPCKAVKTINNSLKMGAVGLRPELGRRDGRLNFLRAVGDGAATGRRQHTRNYNNQAAMEPKRGRPVQSLGDG